MQALGGRVGKAMTRGGHVVLLRGEVGAGKSVFARGLVRAVTGGGSEMVVPSPTFVIQQSYTEGPVKIHHLDLYRLKRVEEVARLELGPMKEDCVVVEWPDVGMALFDNSKRLLVNVQSVGEGDERRVEMESFGEDELLRAAMSKV